MNYTLKFNFHTIKVSRGGGVRGGGGSAECDITTDYSIEELRERTEELVEIARRSIAGNPKIKGVVQSIDSLEIEQKQ